MITKHARDTQGGLVTAGGGSEELGFGGLGAEAQGAERGSPEHQAHLRSYLNLPWKLSLDAMLYHVGSIAPGASAVVGRQAVPAYTRLDSRLAWTPTRELDLSLGLANLLGPRHPEFISQEAFVAPGNQVSRSI